MRRTATPAHPLRRAHRSLWLLVGIMVVSLGAVTSAAAAPPSPLTGTAFAVGAVVFLLALVLASRVTIALERARRRDRPAPVETRRPILFDRLLRRAPSEP